MVPEGFSARMAKMLGEAYPDFAAAWERPRIAGLRVNEWKRPARLPERFSLTPIPWAEDGYFFDPASRPGLSPLHEAGAYYLQEPSAMAPVELLDVRPGMRALDLCAAPGGKATQIASKLAGRGILIANEIHPQRARILSRNLERCAVANAVALCEDPRRLAERFSGWFDRILVDAPCSGEGMFRKEEAAVRDWSQAAVEACAARQEEILHTAAGMLRPGGRMVYSTCTFSPEENEGVIARFLRRHEEFSLAEISGTPFDHGRPEWADGTPELARTFRLWPHKLPCEGHFAAVLEKDGGEERPVPVTSGALLPKEATEFAAEAGAAMPEGKAIPFGDTWYLAPAETPDLRGLTVLRAGLELGQTRKGRLLPSHGWALWLKDAARTADFPESDERLLRYLRGDAIPGGETGWTLIKTEGLSLSWAKGSGGVLKNHFPKGLRWV